MRLHTAVLSATPDARGRYTDSRAYCTSNPSDLPLAARGTTANSEE